MASRRQSIIALLATVATLATTTMGGLHAADPVPTAAQADFFEKRIRPLLIEHCIDCHGPETAEGKLRLDSKQGWQRGGEQGPAPAHCPSLAVRIAWKNSLNVPSGWPR